MQRIGYAVGAAAVGIAANLAGLGAGISVAAAKSAAFWVFASFVPLRFWDRVGPSLVRHPRADWSLPGDPDLRVQG